MRTLIPAITASLVALLLACQASDHPQGAEPHSEAHGNGHGRGAEAITHWTEETELFVQHVQLRGEHVDLQDLPLGMLGPGNEQILPKLVQEKHTLLFRKAG